MSKKNKPTLYKSQHGESNYVGHKFSLIFTRSYLPVQSLGDRHPNTIEVANCLVHVLCDFNATWHQEASFSVCWLHHGHESTSCWCLYFTFLVKVLPPPFHYSLGSYLYLFLLYILLSQNWYQDQFQYLSYQKKMDYFLS